MSKKTLWYAAEERVIESPTNLEKAIPERFLRLAEVQRRVPYTPFEHLPIGITREIPKASQSWSARIGVARIG
jgi:hypothetical protein